MRRVQEANRIVDIVVKVVQLCEAMGVYWVIEQPRGSLLWDYGPMKEVLRNTTYCQAAVELGRVGASSVKPLSLRGNAPWLTSLALEVRRRPRDHNLRPLTARRGRWVMGRHRHLRNSAAYPEAFCEIVARKHAVSTAERLVAQRRRESEVEIVQDTIVVDSD